jgi:Tfp pilus assembly protein PilN
MEGINLLRAHQALPQQKRHSLRLIRISTVVFLIIYCLFVSGVFSYWIYLRGENEKLVTQSQRHKETLKSLESLESQHVLIKQRLSALIPFFDRLKVEYQDILISLENIAPDQVVFSSLNADQDGNFSFKAQASNAVVLAAFIDSLMVIDQVKGAKLVSLESAARQADGAYIFSVKFDAQN